MLFKHQTKYSSLHAYITEKEMNDQQGTDNLMPRDGGMGGGVSYFVKHILANVVFKTYTEVIL